MTLQPPIRGCVRAASASVGTLIILVGVWQAMSSSTAGAFGIFLIGWGLLMWFPVFARAPKSLSEVEARWRRVVLPALICLMLGFATNGVSWLIDLGHLPIRNAPNVARELGAVGSAFWLVGFVLLLFAAYYSSHRDADRPSD